MESVSSPAQGWKLFELRRRRTGVSEESDLRKRVDPRMASLVRSGASLWAKQCQRCYHHGMDTFRIDTKTDDEYGVRDPPFQGRAGGELFPLSASATRRALDGTVPKYIAVVDLG